MARRIRSVKPEWLEDERLGLASSDARVLSIALMLMADDEGRGRASTVMLGGQVFPGLANPREVSAKALEELRTLDFVALYEVDGQHYFEIRNWGRHQKIDHPTPSKLPKNPHTSDVLANPRESSRAVANPRASRASTSSSLPVPSLPDPEGVQGEPPPPATTSGKIPCPSDLRLTEGQRATLETSGGVPGWAIDRITTDFVSRSQADDGDRRPLAAWRKCLSAAVIGNWHDPAKRPKPDEPTPTPAVPTLTQAQVDAAIARDLAEKRAHLAARRAAAGGGGQALGTIDEALAAAAAARIDPFGKGGRQ